MIKSNFILGVFAAFSLALGTAQGSVSCEYLFKRESKSVQYEIEAENQGLVYVTDFSKGISRDRSRKRFDDLKIPENYNVVWFSPNKNTHIQALAFDSNGKKQYFYHPAWKAIRDKIKYSKLKSFGEALPYVRRQVRKEISFPGFTRTRALAAITMLLDQTGIRIGDEQTAQENETYGLTTLERKHLKKYDGTYYLVFKGKGQGPSKDKTKDKQREDKIHKIPIKDERIISYLQESLRQPGDHLFKYVDEDGNMRFVVSSSVNEYLKNLSGLDISAKDFRTWIGTVTAARFLYEAENRNDEKIERKAAKEAADKLGNTPKVARESYIHPQIFVAFAEGKLFNKAFRDAEGDTEAAVLQILSEVGDESEK
ncbi:MAG: hypothetical protein A4S09_11325 [Proteobacteria bacterium SG_bin7]|nr:MAG: hypothetical protein A4S09_11325 [Proteobacteria bacterium SG_bin7]